MHVSSYSASISPLNVFLFLDNFVQFTSDQNKAETWYVVKYMGLAKGAFI